jgi:hypothetical protein
VKNIEKETAQPRVMNNNWKNSINFAQNSDSNSNNRKKIWIHPIKDKYIILGFIGFAICLISFFITLIVCREFQPGQLCKADSILYAAICWAGCSISPSRRLSLTHTRSTKSSPARKRDYSEAIKAAGRTATEYNEPAAPTPIADRRASNSGCPTGRAEHRPGTSRKEPCQL